MIPIKVETPESCDQYPVSTKVNNDIWDEVSNPPRLEIPFLGWLKFQSDKDLPPRLNTARLRAQAGTPEGLVGVSGRILKCKLVHMKAGSILLNPSNRKTRIHIVRYVLSYLNGYWAVAKETQMCFLSFFVFP